MKTLVLVGGVSVLFGLYGALGRFFVSRGGSVGERGSAYQLAWPFFIRLSSYFLVLGGAVLVSGMIVALV